MNRNEEYHALLSELENPHTPPALVGVVARAGARAKRSRRVRHFVIVPASAVAVLFAAFVTTVNVSADFAEFCERAPVLRKLAAAVAFSPSLTAAVENEYVQTPDGLEQTDNGITMKIEHVIVDPRRLHLFYTLRSDTHGPKELNDIDFHIQGVNGGPSAVLYATDVTADEPDAIRKVTAEFAKGQAVPNSLEVSCRVATYKWERNTAADSQDDPWKQLPSEPLAAFHFALQLDGAEIRQAETVTLNQEFVINGQKITVTEVEFLPTHTRVTFVEDENNTAKLYSMDLHAVNERGERFGSPQNGISSSGGAYHLESAFFAPSSHWTIYVTNLVWRDKDTIKRVKVDLANGVAEGLPPRIRLLQVTRKDDNTWKMKFHAADRERSSRHGELFESIFYDEAGKVHGACTYGWRDYTYDGDTKRLVETPGMLEFTLREYPFDTVYLTPVCLYETAPEPPVEITVK